MYDRYLGNIKNKEAIGITRNDVVFNIFSVKFITPTFLEGGLSNLSSPGFKGMKAFIMTLTFIPLLYGYNMIGLIWPSDVSLLDSVGELRTSRESTLGLTSVT